MVERHDLKRTLWRGDPALVYSAGATSVVVLPQRGGKLASIMHDGREWLTQPRHDLLPLERLPATLVDGDMFGWDECAPTIDACEVLGQYLPLHGDVWNQPWTELEDGWLQVRAQFLDFLLRRRLSVHPGGFRLDYEAMAADRMPFLWAAHPQFAASVGTQVLFGDGSVRLVDLFERGYWGDGPAGGRVDLADLPPSHSAKIFVDPAQPCSQAQLIQPDGAGLQFRWDAAAPYLGVWMDRASIGPVEAIAIEPMTGYADSCESAMKSGRVLWLAPGEPVKWTLAVDFFQR